MLMEFGGGMLLFVLTALIIGCGDPQISPEERIATKTAYDSVLAQLPDSIQEAIAPIDSLFLNYNPALLLPLSVDPAEANLWADSVLGQMSTDEKIGQLFIVDIEENRYAGRREDPLVGVREWHLGGFLVPRLLGPRDVYKITQRLQKEARVPLFFAADYERGVGRFDNALTELPSNMAIGATRDTLFAAAAGRLTALEARAVGVNLLLAPVVDVNNNPDNPIINIRSYGEDPELVGRMASSFIREAQSRGLLTTLKHFPGHGDTSVDSHARMGAIGGNRSKLERVELKPYRIILDGGVRPAAVMSAHLWIKALEPEPRPATFSNRVLTRLLREEMAFEGVVITDDIRMGALRNRYDVRERILNPLLAGANVLLTPANLEEAFGIVRDAVRSGDLPQELLDGSVRRILVAKASAGLHRNALAVEEDLDMLLQEPFGAYISQTIADRSITLLKTSAALPLRPDSQRIAIVHQTNFRSAESIDAAIDLLDDQLEPDESMRIIGGATKKQVEEAVDGVAGADVIVLALYLRLEAGRGEAGLFPRQQQIMRRILDLGRPVVLITFGNPYAASAYHEADAILVAYDQSLQTAYAAARVLRGEQPAPGRLPITVEPFSYGSGVDGR